MALPLGSPGLDHGLPISCASGQQVGSIVNRQKKDVVNLLEQTPLDQTFSETDQERADGRRVIHQVMSIGFTQREETTEPSVTPHKDEPSVVTPTDTLFDLSQRSGSRVGLA
jgi:hypothetical protein